VYNVVIPEAELYVLQIDLGKEKRTLVAGLRPYINKEDLLNKKIIVVTNLEPAKLRGVESQGMLLAADDGKDNAEFSCKIFRLLFCYLVFFCNDEHAYFFL